MPPRYKPSKTAAFFRNLQSKLDPTKLFARKRLPPRPRSIYVNLPLPAESFDKKGKIPKADHYSSNQGGSPPSLVFSLRTACTAMVGLPTTKTFACSVRLERASETSWGATRALGV